MEAGERFEPSPVIVKREIAFDDLVRSYVVGVQRLHKLLL